jgi:hypothetical protein
MGKPVPPTVFLVVLLTLCAAAWTLLVVELSLTGAVGPTTVMAAAVLTLALALWPMLARTEPSHANPCRECGAVPVPGIKFCLSCGAYPRHA